VGRPEIDLPADVDIHADAVYRQGVKNLQAMIQNGTLLQEEKPCLYVYQQRMGDHVQAGLVGLCSVKEYEQGAIKRHEYTRKDKEDDRTRHVTEQNANAEPVFLTYRAVPYIDSLVDKVRATQPVYDVVTPDGIGHTVWVVSEETHIYTLNHLFDAIPALYIADGHHRTAAAIRYGQARRAAFQGEPTGQEPFESFMAVVFPHDQLKIMDYNWWSRTSTASPPTPSWPRWARSSRWPPPPPPIPRPPPASACIWAAGGTASPPSPAASPPRIRCAAWT
jgi:uncharacterized protein (DUF1015 family)